MIDPANRTSAAEQSNGSDLRLYYARGTRATRPRWLLEELGLSYDLVRLDLRAGEQREAAYRAINPAAKVPALSDDDTTLTESLAICLHLADRFPEKGFAPPFGTSDRAQYYQWMAYSVGTLEPAILEAARQRKIAAEGGKHVALSPALTEFPVAASILETLLAQRQFVLGTAFTAADVMTGTLMIWAKNIGLLDKGEHTLEWVERLTARPAYLRATKD